MSFSAGWLLLREPHDIAARNRHVLAALSTHFARKPAITVVDLGCGTGSTLRAIGRHLPSRQHWRLIDKNPDLLAKATENPPPAPQTSVAAMPLDLARNLESALAGPLDLVTASALLDLVSSQWLDLLVAQATARGLPVYAALSYDGRIFAEPRAAFDGEIVAAVNRHQRTDKGFGSALGPSAAAAAAARFAAEGYQIVQGRSDWILGPGDRGIQEEVFASLAALAQITVALSPDSIADWLTFRRHHLVQGRSTLCVGHLDFFACPMGTR